MLSEIEKLKPNEVSKPTVVGNNLLYLKVEDKEKKY